MAYQDLAQKLESLQAQKKAIRDKADAEIAAVKKGLAEKQAALRANERRLRAKTLKTQKQQDDHAKILIGVAMRTATMAENLHADNWQDKYRDPAPEPLSEEQRRRAQIQRAIRLNQNEGLEPTPRLLALADRYIKGEIDLDEYTQTIHGW